MNRIAVAKELILVAKSLMSYGGTHYALNDLPRALQVALHSIGYKRSDIDVKPETSYASGGAFGDGYRGFLIVVNLRTGTYSKSVGSWGGDNMFTDRAVDSDRSPKPLNQGTAIISGNEGANLFAHVLMHPDDFAALKTPEVEVYLTDDEKRALFIIKGIKSSYRASEFQRYNIGPYNGSNPIIKSLEKQGMIKVTGVGISITTTGKNVVETFHMH